MIHDFLAALRSAARSSLSAWNLLARMRTDSQARVPVRVPIDRGWTDRTHRR